MLFWRSWLATRWQRIFLPLPTQSSESYLFEFNVLASSRLESSSHIGKTVTGSLREWMLRMQPEHLQGATSICSSTAFTAPLAKWSTSDRLLEFTSRRKSCGNSMQIVGQRYWHDSQLCNHLVSSNWCASNLYVRFHYRRSDGCGRSLQRQGTPCIGDMLMATIPAIRMCLNLRIVDVKIQIHGCWYVVASIFDAPCSLLFGIYSDCAVAFESRSPWFNLPQYGWQSCPAYPGSYISAGFSCPMFAFI